MSDDNTQPEKLRDAELISPPNTLKQKVGSGGLEESTLAKAQKTMESNEIDFKPQAKSYLDALNASIQEAKSGKSKGEAAIEAMIHPAMQLKAQGGMFHYPIISEIGNILINFLETVPTADPDVLEIVDAHRKSMIASLHNNLKDDAGATGKELRDALVDACNRYHKKK